MIIIGAYPRNIKDNAHLPLSLLQESIAAFPSEVPLHILPFTVADGDGGFALRDWFIIDSTLGDWDHIEKLASERPIIVDCIYNHISLRHKWAKEFLDKGKGSNRLHVYSFKPNKDVKSPRGGSVFYKHRVLSKDFWTLQTFSPNVLDLDLSDPDVLKEIKRHLAFIASKGIWGVRLDSVAYYGKEFGLSPRHHPDAIKNARNIYCIAESYGLSVIPQLNCDAQGVNYFPASLGYKAPIQDFGFSSALLLTVLTEESTHLFSHLQLTENIRLPILRAPRTHDGILMKTPLFDIAQRKKLIAALHKYQIIPRLIEGEAYEFNCSLPYAFSLNTSIKGMWDRILITVALTSCLSGLCYLYFPVLFGFRPEMDGNEAKKNDPRYLNRLPMSYEFYKNAIRSSCHKRLLVLIKLLVFLRKKLQLEVQSTNDRIEQRGLNGIAIHRYGRRLILIINFSTVSSLELDHNLTKPIAGINLMKNKLGPLGFGIWVYDNEANNLGSPYMGLE
jgi:hypothetical protein